jgi:23S rRNA pseudouridine1911/1915/1917 synthase
MINIGQEHIGKRADVFLFEYLRDSGDISLSRSVLRSNWGRLVKINNVFIKPSYKLRDGDVVEIVLGEIDRLIAEIDGSKRIEGEDGELNILFENKDFLVVDKPKGMVIHPGLGNRRNTLANRVRGYLEGKGEFEKKINRAGIVHRLDKGVSGIVVFAKTIKAQNFLQDQFEKHKVKKLYLAKVQYGELDPDVQKYIPPNKLNIRDEIETLKRDNFVPDESWLRVEGYIKRDIRSRVKMEFKKYQNGDGKRALSFIKPISDKEVLVIIHTGRMHQIRASLASLGMYIEGDTLYGSTRVSEMPNQIGLESILLGFKDMKGNDFVISKI